MDCRTQLASLANEELEKGDFLMATKLLTTYIKLEPNNHDLYFERSICNYKLGNFQASFDDVNNAIRLNPDDYNLYYQKGLAQIGLLVPYEQVLSSFKKAIELRAKQEDSKLSDIFNLIKDASHELHLFRRNVGISNDNNQRNATKSNRSSNQAPNPTRAISNDPVDSTTDRPCIQPGPSSSHLSTTMVEINHTKIESNTGGNNLVATNCNTQHQSNTNDNHFNGVRVSSSAIHHFSSINTSHDVSSINSGNLKPTLLIDPTAQQLEDSKALDEWNIRRSERIFLHKTSEPGVSGQPFTGILTDSSGLIIQAKQAKSESNLSSVISVKSGMKRSHAYMDHSSQLSRSKDGASSHHESDVDVDDSRSNMSGNELMNPQKRVMITPSSSMPATSQGTSNLVSTKDDSYSSKYKRLRRDRERARRGTSKLCTIKSADLEELQKASLSPNPSKYVMRVIAPVDGWLYSGQLSFDLNTDQTQPQYVVKLDGDPTGSSYLFSQDTVLNDVIKEVRVKSVSDLRKGARICCYWSRQYKCLSTGVVTSRTFEATKSLVSVKYDNGDLSALPLEDLRLLPPDYPKYMSNCDPLLLAKPEGVQVGNGANTSTNIRPKLDHNSMTSGTDENIEDAASLRDSEKTNKLSDNPDQHPSEDSQENNEGRLVIVEPDQNAVDGLDKEIDNHRNGIHPDDDATIPPTNETIDFITSESTNSLSEDDRILPVDLIERITATKDTISSTEDNQPTESQSSSEENSFGIEYRPWVFEGPLKRNKRHGRTYRDNYSAIRRGNEIIRVGDSAELMPRDESIPPFIAKIDGLWATCRGEMRVRVRWYYRLIETEGQPYRLRDGENALFETDHFDENDVQSIYRSTKILSWTDYRKDHLGHINKDDNSTPKVFYLAGYYDPVRRVKHLRSDIEED